MSRQRVLLVLSVGVAGTLAIGLLLASAPPGIVHVTVDGREVEGPLRVFAAGAAGMFAAALVAALFLVAAFFLAGASLFMGLLLAVAGLLMMVAGAPFLAPLAVLAGLLYLGLRSRRVTRDAA